MSKKPCSISFKPVGKNKPCTTVINGGLKVKKNIVAECDLTVKKCLNVKNIVYSNTETITESGQTVSGVKSLSWINTNGTGVLSDNTKDGFYKKVVKISEGSTTEGWTSVGQTSDINGDVRSICCNNQNDELYILTDAKTIAGIPGFNYVAKWTGSGWTSLGATGQIAFLDGTTSPDLCCDNKGNIYIGSGVSIIFPDFGSTNLAKWNETDGWTTVGNGNINGGGVYNICCNSNDGNLYIGGSFNNVDGVAVGKLAKYNDTDGWSSVGGLTSDVFGSVYKVCCDSKDGSIYIGGNFQNLTTEGLYNLGKYNDIDGWTSVGQTSDINGKVNDICCDSENGDIYIAGEFDTVDGIIGLDKVAKWDAKSQSWTSISGNTGDFGPGGSQIAFSICCKNGEIYVGGQLNNIGGLGINNLAKWTGSSWTSVGGPSDINGLVEDICCDTKNGEIYIGGDFINVAGIPGLNDLARFDQAQNYTLTYNTTEEVTLTNAGENACFIYNETLGEWVKI